MAGAPPILCFSPGAMREGGVGNSLASAGAQSLVEAINDRVDELEWIMRRLF